MARTLLDLAGQQERTKQTLKNIFINDDAIRGGYSPQAQTFGLFENVNASQAGNDALQELPTVLEEGEQLTQNSLNKNITRPDTLDIFSVNDVGTFLQDLPDITLDENQLLLDLLRCNQYVPTVDDLTLYQIDKLKFPDNNQTKYTNRYDFSAAISLSHNSLLDVYLGNVDIDDTPLGIRGAEEIRKSLERNIANNLIEQTAGRVNTDIFNTLTGGQIIKGYQAITIPRTVVGRTADFLARISGAKYPINIIKNISDDSELLAYTSSAQKSHLINSLNRNAYRPELDDPRSRFDTNGEYYIGNKDTNTLEPSVVREFSDSINFQQNINEVGINKGGKESDRGILSDTRLDDVLELKGFIPDEAVLWSSDAENGFTPKSLLYKTQELATKFRDKVWIDQTIKQFKITDGAATNYISKGNSIISENGFTGEDGTKIYFQRELCWSLEDKQLLIDSIYNGINIGKIVIRNRSWKWVENQVKSGNHEVGFSDVVDGKQRLHTIIEFIKNEFPDSYGNYWFDLCTYAQRTFAGFQGLTYGELSESTTDQDVKHTFLTLNHAGKPMSKEHLDFVKSINI